MLRIGHAGDGERPDATAALLDRLAAADGTCCLILRLRVADIEYAVGGLLVECLSKRVRLVVETPEDDPIAVANALAALAARTGKRRPRLGLIDGHELTATQMPAILAGLACDPPAPPGFRLATARAHLGAEPLLALLAKGAEILVAGSLAPSAAAVAFGRHVHRWGSLDIDKIAAAAAAGRILAAGAASVGGDLDETMSAPGLPFVDLAADGVAQFGASHGRPVRVAGLALALLDGVRMPRALVEPDATLDLSDAALLGPVLTGVSGTAPENWLPGELLFEGGTVGDIELSYGGSGAAARALAAARELETRLAALPGDARWRVELVGIDAAAKAAGERARDLAVVPGRDVRLRLAVRGERPEQVRAALNEGASLVAFGPAGAALLRRTVASERRIAAAQIPKSLIAWRATQMTGDL